ncbi:NAD(P)-binding domain-containing protein [Saccharothrix sp. NPDC042600]|uniref:NADPH-dependent F420 reductase n=1 Tax=Saccharothrix TaxID=2071 RepID=UPI0033CA36EC|nr:NAD(P)-binding domain-containing protein [Saccharothrix mutabilis subsp. capreolus]
MKIGVLGTGGMARALGGKWAARGHDVLVGGRSRRKAAALAEDIGARAGELREAVAFGDVVLVAVPARAAAEAVGDARGKVVIDCTNSIADGFLLDSFGAARLAEACGGDVVKAFNLCHVSVWADPSPVYEGRPLGVPVCGDDPRALEVVRELVRDTGCVPVDGGGLDRAALLEATAAFAIGVWVGAGQDVRGMFPTAEASVG